jgi:hypothetical protein
MTNDRQEQQRQEQLRLARRRHQEQQLWLPFSSGPRNNDSPYERRM